MSDPRSRSVVVFCSFTNHIVTASWRRRQALQIWDYGSGELITDLQPDTHESMQTCAQYMGKDFLAAAGGFSNIIRVIDSRYVDA